MINYIANFFRLIFPNKCYGCDNTLTNNEHTLCSNCLLHLPKTLYGFNNQNPIYNIFNNRIDINAATAYTFFKKNSSIRFLLHQLKYKRYKNIGIYLGKLMAYEFTIPNNIPPIDLIIPVPIHYSKKRKRGYNQSEIISRGFSEITSIPINNNSLSKVVESKSQTHKNRWERWKNVEDVFIVKNSTDIAYKHILLIDDVITTGATLEACARKILEIEGCKVSILAFAFAET